MANEKEKAEGVEVSTMNEIFKEVTRQQGEDYPFSAGIEFENHVYLYLTFKADTPAAEKRAFKIRMIAAAIRSLNEGE